MEQKKDRQTWVDYARGIAIIFVLYRHVYEGIKASGISVSSFHYLENANIFFYSFRMPLFFIASGIFIGGSIQKRGLKGVFINKVQTILYPYFIWGAIQITLQLVLSGSVNSNRSVGDYLYLIYLPRMVDQFWYLYALFNVSVFYLLIVSLGLSSKFMNLVVGFAMYFFNAFFEQRGIVSGFVGDVMHYYIYFAIGTVVSVFVLGTTGLKYFASWRSFFLLLPFFIFCQSYYLSQNISFKRTYYDYVEYFEPVKYFIISMIGCGFVYVVSFLLQRYGVADWVRYLGRYSLYIYLLHVVVTAAWRILLVNYFGLQSVPFVLLSGVLLGLWIPVLVYRFALKVNFSWLFSLDRSKIVAEK